MGKEQVKNVEQESPVYRFPRTNDKVIKFVAKLRAKYPPPVYNWRYDGSMNPADMVLDSLVKSDKKKLRQLCKKHSMETWGNKRRLIKRMYMHWRASKLNLGDPQIGYGKGYECVEQPHCVCGFRRRADAVAHEKRKVELKELAKRQREEAEGLWRKVRRRFPRLRFARLRFPRFKRAKDALKYYNEEFQKVVKDLSRIKFK